jgi:hypothetical protein
LQAPLALCKAGRAADRERETRVREIEVKYRVDDLEELPAALKAQGIELSDPVYQDDQAYAPATWQFGDSKLGVSFLRLRTVSGRHLLEHMAHRRRPHPHPGQRQAAAQRGGTARSPQQPPAPRKSAQLPLVVAPVNSSGVAG